MTDEEKRMVEFNNYIDDLNIDALIKFMNGESDDFEPIPTLTEVVAWREIEEFESEEE